MGIRGRPSAAELSTVVGMGFRRRKPAPPGELTDAQAAVWRDCIGSISIARGAYPILIEYCRRVCRSRLLEAQIVAFELEWAKVPGGLERFDRLLAMADRESRTCMALARSLRLTPQSQVQPRTAARMTADEPALDDDGNPVKRPWD